MLKDLREVSKDSIDVVSRDSLEEVKIPPQLRRDLQSGVLQGNLSVNSYSSYARTSTTNSNYAIFPNQMYKFSALIYDFAFEVKKYFECINKYKIKNEILELCSTDYSVIKDKIIASGVFSEDFDENDYELFSKFILLGEGKIKNDEFRLGGKSIFNRKDGKTTIRSNEDCFGSIILTQINLPNSSSSIFGDLIYGLTENEELYRNVKNYFENVSGVQGGTDYPSVIFSHSTIRSFIYGVVKTLVDRSDDKFFFDALEHASDGGKNYAELVNQKRIYRMFQVSENLLKEDELKSGNLSRWFKDAFEFDGKHYYLTNQWVDQDGDQTASRNIQAFIEVFNKLDSKYRVTKLQDTYRLTCSEVDGLDLTYLPKPFLLLAGISGTGKTRFVREQALKHNVGSDNFCLVPVRPDWHEPSDLLGYVSRIGEKPEYVSTKVLQFIIEAWKAIAPNANADGTGDLNLSSPPYWLCLDEMNLAPVEQYFADYLSVLESRKIEDGEYTCEPLLDSSVLSTNGAEVRSDLGLDNDEDLWKYFVNHGISIPPNLIVAGTVNMDETTHGFSRKVIDRALTIDFGEFFPNDYSKIFGEQSTPKTFTYSLHSQITREALHCKADPSGDKTIAFLQSVNDILKDTPFELAYRALNELLLHVCSFAPDDDASLQAVWDDFLMTKILPRIDGDEDKLRYLHEDGQENLLVKLNEVVSQQLPDIWSVDKGRVDLFRVRHDGTKIIDIPCRSKKKIQWMKNRLDRNTFTSYWP